MKFSVIIPTHDRDDLLVEAVKSAARQTLAPVEIIVVDDVSSDKTREVVESLDGEFGRVVYVANPHRGGASQSRNMGTEAAAGDAYAFLDDDDFWDERYLETAGALMDQGVDVILSPLTGYRGEGDTFPGKNPPQEFVYNDYFLRNPGVLCSNVCVRAESFRSVGGYAWELLSSSDKELFMRLKKAGASHKVLEERLVYWRTGHGDQWSTDLGRTLPGVIRFYRRYFFRIPFRIHLGMIKKIVSWWYLIRFKGY